MEPVKLNWSQGEHEFLLRIGELEALDDITKDGVMDLRYRLSLGQHRGTLGYSPVKTREMIDAIRLGLIGAGMERNKAAELARRGFEESDVSETALMAYAIISNSLKGKEHDHPGEEKAGAVKPASSSEKSTVKRRSSGSRQSKPKE